LGIFITTLRYYVTVMMYHVQQGTQTFLTPLPLCY